MNFGKWIVVAFLLFAAFIGTLVVVCVRQDVSLVSKNYYSEELDYQKQIERIINTSQLTEKPSIAAVDGKLQVHFSEEFKIQKGEMKLFCPANPKMDKSFSLSVTHSNSQQMDLVLLPPGLYKAKLSWTMNNKEYFFEQVIYI
jgi:hypothetical protein